MARLPIMSDVVLNTLKDKSLYKEKHALIDGQWVSAKGGKTFDVIGEQLRLGNAG